MHYRHRKTKYTTPETSNSEKLNNIVRNNYKSYERRYKSKFEATHINLLDSSFSEYTVQRPFFIEFTPFHAVKRIKLAVDVLKTETFLMTEKQ